MKKKTLLSAMLTIALCLGLIAGSTYALFTGTDEVNIAVTSGKVAVIADIDRESLTLSPVDEANTEIFQNGGSATFDENGNLVLTNITPGDKATFNINITNESNVKIQYRLTWAVKGELSGALVATADGNKIATTVSDWYSWDIPATGSDKKTVAVSVELPIDADNDYQDKTALVFFRVEAVQFNGTELYRTPANTFEDLRFALEMGGDIAVTGTMDANGVLQPFAQYPGETVEYYLLGNKVYSLSGGTYTMDEGAKYGIYVDGNDGNIDLSNMKINANSKWSFVIDNTANSNVSVADVEITAQSGAGLYGVGGKIVLNNVKVNHLAFDPAYSDTPWGATAVAAAGNTDMTINSGEYYGSTYALYTYSSGGTITINGGNFKAPVVVAADAQNGANTYVNINGGNFDGKFESVNVFGGSEALITINGGNFTNFSTTANKRITIKGGTFDADPAQWVADGYQVTENNGVWTVTPYEVSTAADLVEKLTSGKAVVLTDDIDISKIDLTTINNDVVIDAAGHKITTSDSYGIEVTAGKNVTISNADVVMTKEGDYITYAAGFKIANGDYAGATITLQNCKISMANGDWSYGVNLPAGVKNLNFVIDNCVLEGAIAVQCWGDNNTIQITNSKLICNYTTSAAYTSTCVALQGDGANFAENNTLVIDNCEFSYNGVDNFDSPIGSVWDMGKNNTVTVTNCTYGEKITK